MSNSKDFFTRSEEKGWNVIDIHTFQGIIEEVFEKVAERLSFTMGPYCGNTILERGGQTIMTKDGWTVLKHMAFTDPVYNAVLSMLKKVCFPVVVNVGDGSTTAIQMANLLYKNLKETNITNSIRPKDLIAKVEKVCTFIGEKILESSNKISSDGTFEEIYRIALTSTNQNDEFAKMIHDIYVSTGNPTIDFIESRGIESSVEMVEGYRVEATYLDRIYQTTDSGDCIIKNPVVLLFDYKISKDDYNKFIVPTLQNTMGNGMDTRLVVIAPYYDEEFLDAIRIQANTQFKSSGTTAVVYGRVPISKQDNYEMYKDLSASLGSEILTLKIAEEHMDKYKNGELFEKGKEFAYTDFIGTCDEFVINDKNAVAKGLYNKNETELEMLVLDIQAQYKRALGESMKTEVSALNVFSLKKRLARLSGKMGIIHVGGRTDMEKRANMDAVEDAVKACESAYTYGYNIGGSLVVPFIMKKYINESSPWKDDLDYEVIVDAICKSCIGTYATVLGKYFTTQEEIDTTINESISSEKIFNLISKKYTTDVINPCMTDVEVLKAASNMVSLLLSSSQYLTMMPSEVFEGI